MCSEGVDSSNQEVDPQISDQVAPLLVEDQQAKYPPGMRRSLGKVYKGMGPQTVLGGGSAFRCVLWATLHA